MMALVAAALLIGVAIGAACAGMLMFIALYHFGD